MEFDTLRSPSDFEFREKLVFPRSLPAAVAPSSPDPPSSLASGGSAATTTDDSISSGPESPDNAGSDGEREMPWRPAPAARDGGGGDGEDRFRELILGPHDGVPAAAGGSGDSPVDAGWEAAAVGGQKESGAEAGSNVLRAPGREPPESSAVVNLQKVHRSYCTRRRLYCRNTFIKNMCYLQLLILLASVAWATASGAVVHVGTASYYGSPYTPTVCNGDNPSQLPSDNLFAAVGSELWDNGAACGREYTVRCVSLSQYIPGNCTDDGPIKVKIIDWALSSNSAAAAFKQAVEGATLVLPEITYKQIAKPFADLIDIEYQE